MNRRNFLRGSILSLAGTSAIVKLATPEEAAMLTATEPVAIGNLERQHYPGDAFVRSPEVYIRQRNGTFLCIGMMTQIKISQDVMDMISWDGHVTLIPGLKRGELLFEGKSR